jgi:16S rRNA (cytidine1402-2'-O)-methyltransferase
MSGCLQIVSTPIGNLGDLSVRATSALEQADIIACEDTRTTRKLLALTGRTTAARLVPYHDHNGATMRPRLLADIADGKVVVLVSDAGTPLISDPGYKLVAACHEHGFTVTSIPGPSAPLAALAVSGLPSDQFMFAGFLPSTAKACRNAIQQVSRIPMTMIWFESPRRLCRTLETMADVLGPRLGVVARELTKMHEESIRAPLPELAAIFRQRETIKGELVLLVEGFQASDAEFDDVDLAVLLRQEMTKSSLRDAVNAVADMTGLPRRNVYQFALSLSDGKSSQQEPSE